MSRGAHTVRRRSLREFAWRSAPGAGRRSTRGASTGRVRLEPQLLPPIRSDYYSVAFGLGILFACVVMGGTVLTLNYCLPVAMLGP